MKKFLLSSVLVSCALSITAQNDPVNSGKITYEEKVKIEIKIDGDAGPMAANLPKERRSEKILSFNTGVQLFEDGNSNLDEEMASPDQGDGNVRIRMVISGENKTYTDLKEGKIIEQRDFMNRIFLVKKDIPRTDWKISGNQKVILGYNCIEAVKTDTAGIKTVAWFAPTINVGGGPAELGNLPGMILEADINNGSRVYTAKSVVSINPDENKIQRLKEGKQVTEEEYRKIVSEKMKEMGIEEGGSGNQMRIVIRHN